MNCYKYEIKFSKDGGCSDLNEVKFGKHVYSGINKRSSKKLHLYRTQHFRRNNHATCEEHLDNLKSLRPKLKAY